MDPDKYLNGLLTGEIPNLPTAERAFVAKLREQDAHVVKIQQRLSAIEAQQKQLAVEQQQLVANLNRAAGACAAISDVLVAAEMARLPEMELREPAVPGEGSSAD